MTSSVGAVSSSPITADFRALTCENYVSEGGLEPPCPLRALAPQASASAYSATRTRDARGTHRLSHLSKPNALRRVPSPVNLARDATLQRSCRARITRHPRCPHPLGQPHDSGHPCRPLPYVMDVAFTSSERHADQLESTT